jgi:hypothetical protein
MISSPYAKKTQSVTITMTNWLTLSFKEIIAAYFENHTKPTNTLCWQNVELLNAEVGGAYNYHCVLNG